MAATPKPVRKMEKKGISDIKKSFSSGRAGSETEKIPKKTVDKMAKKHEKNLSSVLGRKHSKKDLGKAHAHMEKHKG